jgi:hypothetical protein
MKRLSALSCALLSLITIAPMVGCGGSGTSTPAAQFLPESESEPATRTAIVIGEEEGRAVQVSWKNIFSPEHEMLQYQIYRAVVPTSEPTIDPDVYESVIRVVRSGKNSAKDSRSCGCSITPRPKAYFTLIGVADGQTTTFTDTTTERNFERQNLGEIDLTYDYATLLAAPSAVSTSGLKSGKYIYSVRAVYRVKEGTFGTGVTSLSGGAVNRGPFYGESTIVARTNEVAF